MLTRRAFTVGLAAASLVRTARAGSSSPRLALLFGAPWKGETWLGNGVGKMQSALQQRGFTAAETLASSDPLDRARLTRRLSEIKKRIAGWRQGEIFLYYDGHGMYARAGGVVPEPGLQLHGDREDPGSAMLWREVWDALSAPPGVRVLAVPDCCHTNLLGRLPRNTTAVIMKSEPQDTLTCRTGGFAFGEGAARKRYGIISYYTASTVAEADTAGDWLAAMDAAAERDVIAGRLPPGRRPRLMIEGDATAPLPGRAMRA